MSVDGRAVANFILDFCEPRSRPVTNLSLQKIVYFCHVWSLIRLRRPLVKHAFEAWQYGPVLPYLYRELREFDSEPIIRRAMRINSQSGIQEIVPYHFDDDTEKLLQEVVDFYSRLRAGDLVELSHASGGPWEIVWNHKGPVNPGMKIDNAKIEQFYSAVRAPFSIQ